MDTSIPDNTQCPANCSYLKDDNQEEIWCFKQENIDLNYTFHLRVKAL